MASLTPYLFSADARAQADFYIQALGGDIVSVQTYDNMPNTPDEMKNKVLHMHLVAAGVPFYLCDDPSGQFAYGNGLSLSLEFATEEEAHQAFAKLAEGGEVKHPLQREFWGALFGQLVDKFGIAWMITGPAPAQG